MKQILTTALFVIASLVSFAQCEAPRRLAEFFTREGTINYAFLRFAHVDGAGAYWVEVNEGGTSFYYIIAHFPDNTDKTVTLYICPSACYYHMAEGATVRVRSYCLGWNQALPDGTIGHDDVNLHNESNWGPWSKELTVKYR